jgi:hypothetical protein
MEADFRAQRAAKASVPGRATVRCLVWPGARLDARLDARRAQLKYHLAEGRAVFEVGVERVHRRLRTGVLRYLSEAPLRHIAVVPFIYTMVIPFALLDVSLWFYQWICFPAWGISRVPRGQYVVIDRHRLEYLNAIEKLNCIYCGSANGIVAYAREVAGRTEQYWCPIRHATQIRGVHARYKDFVDYGDAEGYRARLEELCAKLR